jgi:heme oxygenase
MLIAREHCVAATMLRRLDAETRAHHIHADAPWFPLMSPDVTKARYTDHLITVYGFEAPIEAALALTARVGFLVQLRQRARSGLIVQDLLTLGMTPSQIARLPQCSKILPFRDLAEAMGWMYVVERATLLYEAIRRHVEGRIPHAAACSYLSAYDGMTSERWEEFGATVDKVAYSPRTADQMLAAARAAFACHRAWFCGEPMLETRRPGMVPGHER